MWFYASIIFVYLVCVSSLRVKNTTGGIRALSWVRSGGFFFFFLQIFQEKKRGRWHLNLFLKISVENLKRAAIDLCSFQKNTQVKKSPNRSSRNGVISDLKSVVLGFFR